ncbi:MAG: AsmA family protein, partial [Planctomycetota bacterium]
MHLRARRQWQRILRILMLLILIPLVLGSLLLFNAWALLHPEQIHARALSILEQHLAVPFRMDPVSFHLLQGLTVNNLVIESPPGSRSPTAVVVPKLHLDFRLLDLLFGKVRIESAMVEGLRIHLERDGEGVLNLNRLIRSSTGEGPKRIPIELPTVVLKDVEVETCPETLFRTEVPFKISRLTLGLRPEVRGAYELQGWASYPSVRRIQLSGGGNLQTREFKGTLEILRLRIDDYFRSRIPQQFVKVIDAYQINGMANLIFDFEVREGRFDTWKARLEVIEASLAMRTLPVTIDSISGLVLVTPNRIVISEPLKGLAWHGAAELSGAIDFAEGEIRNADFRVKLDHIPLSRETRRLLPESQAQAWDQLSPKGRLGLSLHAWGSELPPSEIDLKLRFDGVTIEYRDFPYPLENLTGTVEIGTENIFLDLRGGSPEAPIQIFGTAPVQPGEQELDMHLRMKNLLLDSRLEAAMHPSLRGVWQRYSPGGRADLEIWVNRPPGMDENMLLVLTLTAKRASMRYAGFNYLIEDLKGEIRVSGFFEKDQGRSRFIGTAVNLSQLEGQHGSSKIQLAGGEILFPDDSVGRPRLDLEIYSPNLGVDRDLISAMPDQAAEMVKSFGVRGELETRVHLITEGDGPTEVRVTANVVPPVRIRYQQFPYPLTFHKGTATYLSRDQSISFQGFESDPTTGPLIRFGGSYTEDPEDHDKNLLSLDLVVEEHPESPGLILEDPELMRSQPPDMRNLLERLAAAGKVTGDIHVKYSFRPGGDGKVHEQSVSYQGELTGKEASGKIGNVKITDVDTEMSFQGEAGPGPENPHTFSAVFHHGSFRFSRFLVKNVKSEVYYGRQHPAIVLALDGKLEGTPEQYFPVGEPFLSRLGPNQVRQVLQVNLDTADIYNGKLQGFFFVDVGSRKDFYADAQVWDMDLKVGEKDLFRGKGAAGLASGHVTFGGVTDRPKTLTGSGTFEIRQGKLQQIPMVAALILNPLITLALEPEDRFIEEVDAEFRIEGDRFIVDNYADFKLRSNVLEIRGKGYLDFKQNVDFIFEPKTFA